MLSWKNKQDGVDDVLAEDINNIANELIASQISIDQLRLSKQDKLTAGDGITIDENNVISATGGGGGTVGDWEQLIDVTTQEDASSFSFTFKDVKELIVMISGIATKPRVNFYSNGMTNFFHYYFLGADKFASNYMYIRRRLGGMRYVESGNASSGQPDLISSYELVSDATSCGKLVSSTNDMVNDLRFGLNSQEVLKSGARIQIFGR